MLKYCGLLICTVLFLTFNLAHAQIMDDSFKKQRDNAVKNLSPLQFYVTQECGTEPPFNNTYWNHNQEGIYVDIVSGEPLFSSLDKFDSKSGWPSFTKPIKVEAVKERKDLSHGMVRVEVRSSRGDSHLGHVFTDGPAPTGLRYCINSASLRFIPRSRLQSEGYGEFEELFNSQVVGGSENGEGINSGSNNGGANSRENVNNIGASDISQEVAILGGGCFWGVQELIRSIPGVISTEVGYTGGQIDDPNYRVVTSGKSGHAESVRVVFDPGRLTYKQLLHYFFKLHDPTTLNSQGNDRGTQYRSAIFFTSPLQQSQAKEVIKEVSEGKIWNKPIVTKVEMASKWYRAEDYHQDYLQKNPGGYTCHYWRE